MDMIVAADRSLAIGKNGGMLYSIPEDMKYFRRMTAGKTVLMGRKTLESFPGGKPLKNRVNVVLSSDKSFAPEGVVAVHSVEELLDEAAKYPEDEVMLIGGSSLYNTLYDKCKRVYVTWVDAVDPEADSFIPDFHRLEGWKLESESPAVETGGYTIHFACYLNTAL